MAFIFLTDFRLSKEYVNEFCKFALQFNPLFIYSYRYHHLIMCGLTASMVGDALLDYKHGALFEFGMLAFAAAQIFYINAFGMKPLRLLIGIIFYVAGGSCEHKKVLLKVYVATEKLSYRYSADAERNEGHFEVRGSFVLFPPPNHGLEIQCQDKKLQEHRSSVGGNWRHLVCD
jgi:YhhN family